MTSDCGEESSRTNTSEAEYVQPKDPRVCRIRHDVGNLSSSGAELLDGVGLDPELSVLYMYFRGAIYNTRWKSRVQGNCPNLCS